MKSIQLVGLVRDECGVTGENYLRRNMNPITAALKDLFERTPRRHSPDNVKEINAIISQYENILIEIESVNPYYERNVAVFFEDLEKVRIAVKKSTDNKASKKSKDDYFAEASGDLKESINSLIQMYSDGSKIGPEETA